MEMSPTEGGVKRNSAGAGSRPPASLTPNQKGRSRMALDDYLEPEVAVAAAVATAVTAMAVSPPVRRAVRRGLVYGLAGLLIVGDRIAATARSVAEGAQEAAAGDTSPAPRTAPQPAPTS